MASYNQQFNSDDSIFRHIIIGLLADLNNKVYFYRQIDGDNRKAIDIPFYYSISGDDQFLRDNFLFSTATGPDCHPSTAFADGNYDVVPRGVVNLTGMSIDADKLVNKRNVGSYTKMNSDGAMEGYTAEFEMIPITLSVDLEILVSSTLDAFKITERLIKTLYKSNSFNVEVGHLNEATYRLNSYYAIPEDFEIQSPIDFTFEDKDKYKISFPIEINSHIPSFDFESERHIGNRMFEMLSSTIPTNNETTSGAIETSKITEDTNEGVTINRVLRRGSSFNQVSNVHSPSDIDSTVPLDSTINTGLVVIKNGSYNQEKTLLSTNGTVTLDSSNFAGAIGISIAVGGVVNIKFYAGQWYIVSSSNTTINY